MATVDKIGRHDIVNKICYLVDHLPQDDNFCLALNGAWGSGKSAVIEFLQDKLSKQNEYIIVHYDAWKNNFYSDPLIAMLYSISDTLEKTFFEKTEKRAKKTAAKLIKNAAESALAEAAKGKGYVGFIARAILKVRNVIQEYRKTAFTNDSAYEEYKSYAIFLSNTIGQLNEITTQKIIKDKQIRFVVLVDEIDRCLPDEQLKVLERMHHLFAIKNCAVIVALNKDAIHLTFEKHYGGNSDDYLRKFFQYSFDLPINANVLLRNRLIDLFYYINDKREEAIIERGVNFIIGDLVKVATDIVDAKSKKIDNRNIERYINISSKVVEHIVSSNAAYIWFALQMVLYRMFSEEHYKSIVEQKNALKPIVELCPYYRKNLEVTSSQPFLYYNDAHQMYTYQYYTNTAYNDLLYLFNICKYRVDSQLAVNFANTIQVPHQLPCSEAIEQVKTIIYEIERYGDCG